jgi:hypothetical protein
MVKMPSSRRATSHLVEPHKQLMAAVLQTVLDDCRGSAYRRAAGYGVAANPRGVRRAVAYMMSTDRTWPFSFDNLCEALDLDAATLRREMHEHLNVQRRAQRAAVIVPDVAAS